MNRYSWKLCADILTSWRSCERYPILCYSSRRAGFCARLRWLKQCRCQGHNRAYILIRPGTVPAAEPSKSHASFCHHRCWFVGWPDGRYYLARPRRPDRRFDQKNLNAAAGHGNRIRDVRRSRFPYPVVMGGHCIFAGSDGARVSVAQNISARAAGRIDHDAALERIFWRNPCARRHTSPGSRLLRFDSFRATDRRSVFCTGVRNHFQVARRDVFRIPKTN